MVRFAAPAAVQIRRAQLVLILAALVPTALMAAVGIVLLAVGRDTAALVAGVLVLTFCTSAVTGFVLGSIFLSRGATVARFQHDFLSAVSHELRTPMTSMQMFVETLRNERMTDPVERRQCLDVLDQEIRRLNGLVERLIKLSRMEARSYHFERAEVRVEDVVNDAMAAYDAATMGDRVPVEVSIEDREHLTLRGDREALAQAVANLLVNAWKYGGTKDRRISLTASAHHRRHIELVVSDNGPGIPLDEQPRIFDHFHRGRAAIDGASGGAGLGLAIVRAIVRGHRGSVELRSAPGRGTQFRLRLPRARAERRDAGAA